ncbi:acid protease [Suillus paluster]|uniref:acid protease n=1 Tax=Suillus paluster TaxID=48578 RepID=UPI001B8706FA|nr:acid protease [Suillus paluster]KAG1735318.1 acid protease [Suillus paluster]
MVFSPFTLPALAFLSLSASASPRPRTTSSTASLKLAVRINSEGITNVVAADRARAQALLQGSSSSSIDATNAVRIYTTDVGVGSPPTNYTLLVDTGSSNTWIGGYKPYEKTTTSQDTGGQFSVAYRDSSHVSGEEYLDTVTLNSHLVIEKQSIGVVADYHGNHSLDGILGLGPVDLTQGTVSNAYEVPTVMDNLYAQNTIISEVLGVFFSPASSGDSSGELTFGGYDASKTTGPVSYVPITSTSPANKYWGFDQSISYGYTPILTKAPGIVDTGTNLILIATDAFDKYKSATGGTLDETTGLLKISPDQYDQLLSLYFTIGDGIYELTPNAQIWPRSLNSAIRGTGTTDGIYLVVSDIGNNSGSGLDVINGYCFLERFYSVLDKTNSQVGFATTEYTHATLN